jgi:hypothetical protein
MFALRRCRVHRIPHPTFVTTAKRPSFGTGFASSIAVSTNAKNEIFFATGLDTKSRSQPVGQINLEHDGFWLNQFEG